MIDLFGRHAANDGDLVCDAADVGEKRGDLRAAFSVFLKVHKRPSGLQFGVLQLCELLSLGERGRKRLAVNSIEFGLGVQRFHVGWPSGHAQVNDSFCFRRDMG